LHRAAGSGGAWNQSAEQLDDLIVAHKKGLTVPRCAQVKMVEPLAIWMVARVKY